ncbi:MAG: glycosyltransferase family 39 protein [Acidobacteriales bacterium]|nr:glycosyltransferase family 39 protein [Terriglobales bacterium]
MSCAGRNLLPAAGAFVVFYTAAVMLQYASGAYQSEFGAHPDEPAHAVTSLLVRDYIAGGFSQSPMRFAESYYAHYPKVALGHWPPVYYVLQAVWNLGFPATRASILACHALFAALLASLLFHWAHPRFGSPIALATGFWLLSYPQIEWLNSAVMLDIPVALFVLAAVLTYGDYLHVPGWRPAARFGTWACLAILTKGTGIVLALLPIVCLLLARRWKLIARPSFWLPAAMVAAICGPWYYFAPEALQQRTGFLGAPAIDPTEQWAMFWTWAGRIGAPILILAGIGIAANRRAFHLESRDDARWVSGVAGVCSMLMFLAVARSADEARNMAPLVAPLLLFAVAGIVRLAEPLPRWHSAAVLTVLASWTVVNVLNVPRKVPAGYTQAAALVSAPQYRNSVFLVSGDSVNEGMFISEVALAERRPSHIVLRASKFVSKSGWPGDDYSTSYHTIDAIEARLKEAPVGILVLQSKLDRPREHHDLLLRMVESHPGVWRLLASYPDGATGGGPEPRLRVYELAGHQGMPRGGVWVRLEDKLGRDVEP